MVIAFSYIFVTPQYLVWESSMALVTSDSLMSFPVKRYSIFIEEKTLGWSSVISAVMFISNDLTSILFFCRIETTSLPVQPPRASSINSFGRIPALLPPKSSGPSMVIQWFESVFPTKLIPLICFTKAFTCDIFSPFK